MKILFDVVYTQVPSRCSTSYLVWGMIEALLPVPNLFFYVTVPSGELEPADIEFLSRFPDRVTLVPVSAKGNDRVRSLYSFPGKLSDLLVPWNKDTWDIDIVVSSRIPMLKFMRTHGSRKLGNEVPSYRMFVGIEEMPVLPFRKTVAWHDFMYPDTLMSYAMVDAVLVTNLWTRDHIRPALREVLSPAYQKKVMDRLHEVVPVKLAPLNLREAMYDGGEFVVSYAGRSTATSNFAKVADLFRKSFSYPLGKNKQSLVFRGSSQGSVALKEAFGDTSFWEIKTNSREDFYRFLEETHVLYIPSASEDFSMSVYEALSRGVPIILHDFPWNSFLGESYPFRVKSDVEAYAMVSALAADYAGMYAKFRAWHDTHWMDLINSSKNVTAVSKLAELYPDYVARRASHVAGIGAAVAAEVAEWSKAVPEGGLLDLTQHLLDTDRMKNSMPQAGSLVSRFPQALLFKLKAEELGWVDTQTPGVMARPEK